MTEHRLRLPWTAPPLSGNDRMHWRKKAAITAAIREEVRNRVALSQFTTQPWPVDAAHVVVELHYWPRDRRRRDADNLWPTLKVCADALVDAGVTADDTPREQDKRTPVIHEPDGDPRLELVVKVTP